MDSIRISLASDCKEVPPAKDLGFGKYYADHMFAMDFDRERCWHNAQIIPYQDFSLDPATATIHYGQAIFEGIKVFRTEQGKIALFRPLEYLQRLNKSAKILCIPQVDLDLLYQGLQRLLQIDQRWIPAEEGTSLYIRPVVMALDKTLSVKASTSYKLFVITSPVGAYYAAGFNPVSIKVEDRYVRAVAGGIGEAKTPANYAASLRAQVEANEAGFDQVLWLDAKNRNYVEEVGTMNIFFKIKGELVTPALNGSILGGITRKTVLEQAIRWGYHVSERPVTISEVFTAHQNGSLEEVFGSGTAAVISPVGELAWKETKITINNRKTGPLAQRLFDYITGVQYGRLADESGWMTELG